MSGIHTFPFLLFITGWGLCQLLAISQCKSCQKIIQDITCWPKGFEFLTSCAVYSWDTCSITHFAWTPIKVLLFPESLSWFLTPFFLLPDLTWIPPSAFMYLKHLQRYCVFKWCVGVGGGASKTAPSNPAFCIHSCHPSPWGWAASSKLP